MTVASGSLPWLSGAFVLCAGIMAVVGVRMTRAVSDPAAVSLLGPDVLATTHPAPRLTPGRADDTRLGSSGYPRRMKALEPIIAVTAVREGALKTAAGDVIGSRSSG